jgi:hypothetical protein
LHHLALSFKPSQLRAVICELIVGKLVDVWAQFDSTLYCVAPAVPPNDIVLYIKALTAGPYGVGIWSTGKASCRCGK